MIILPALRRLPLLVAVLAAMAAPVLAAPTTIDLSAEASRAAANDLARATVFAEATGATPGELAKRINSLIADSLKTAKGYASIKTQSGGTHTYPVYAKGGKIDAWRMRSDLTLESSDPSALSELLGKLQASLGVSGVVMLPVAVAFVWQSALCWTALGLVLLGHVFGVMAALLPGWLYWLSHRAVECRAGQPATSILAALSVIAGSVTAILRR